MKLILLLGVVCASVQRWDRSIWPSARYGHTLTQIKRSNITYGVLFGGWPWDAQTPTDELFVYNPQTFKWNVQTISGQTAPPNRHYHSAVSKGNRLIIFGGIRGSQYLNDLFVLDIGSFSWTEIPCNTCPSGRFGHTANILESFKTGYFEMVVFGGSAASPLNDVAILKVNGTQYDWELVPSDPESPQERFHHASVVFRYTLYTFGGTQGSFALNDPYMYVFDILKREWTFPLDIPGSNPDNVLPSIGFTDGIFGHSAQLITLDRTPFILITGGYTTDYNQDVILYSISEERWIVMTNPSLAEAPTPRRNAATMMFDYEGDQFLLQFGGLSTSTLDSLDVLSIRYPVFNTETRTFDTTRNPYQIFWTGSYVTSVSIQTQGNDAEFSKVIIEGWGFNEDSVTSPYMNSIALFPLANPNDPDSYGMDLLESNRYDCLVEQSSFNTVDCVTTFLPNGYFLLSASVINSSDAALSTAWSRQFGCLAQDYIQVSLTDNSSQFIDFACIRQARVDSISPSAGTGGSVLKLVGSGFPTKELISVKVSGVECTIIAATPTTVQCEVPAHRELADAPVTLEVKNYITRGNEQYLKIQPASFSTSPTFDYVLSIDRVSVNTRVGEDYQYIVRFTGQGFDANGTYTVSVVFPSGTQSCVITSISLTELVCSFSSEEAYQTSVQIQIARTTGTATISGEFCQQGDYSVINNNLTAVICFNQFPLETRTLTETIYNTRRITNIWTSTQFRSVSVTLTAFQTSTDTRTVSQTTSFFFTTTYDRISTQTRTQMTTHERVHTSTYALSGYLTSTLTSSVVRTASVTATPLPVSTTVTHTIQPSQGFAALTSNKEVLISFITVSVLFAILLLLVASVVSYYWQRQRRRRLRKIKAIDDEEKGKGKSIDFDDISDMGTRENLASQDNSVPHK